MKYFPTAGTSILPYFGGVIGGSQVKLPQTSDKLYPAIGFMAVQSCPSATSGRTAGGALERRIVTLKVAYCVNGAFVLRLQGGVVSQWEGNIGLGLRF